MCIVEEDTEGKKALKRFEDTWRDKRHKLDKAMLLALSTMSSDTRAAMKDFFEALNDVLDTVAVIH